MTDSELRQANLAVVRRYIDAINAWDFDTKRALLAEDAVFEMPYAPDGFQRRIVGRDNIIAFVETIPAIIDAENLHDVRVETFHSDPGEIVAEYYDPIRLVVALGGSVQSAALSDAKN